MYRFFSILLAPLSFIYGLGVSLYQSLYSTGFFKSVKFSIPVISIGNLSVGGTGKSPHIEYLVNWLKPYLEMAVLSRGYNRKTVGYILLNEAHQSTQVGDEPLQIKLKFPDLPVAVSESRALAIPKIISQFPNTKLILLDDAFQHLQVLPGLQILLTEYSNPYSDDFLLPSGRLREWRYGAKRAQAIIVTKCPTQLGKPSETEWRKKLKLFDNQKLFFSNIEYGAPYHLLNKNDVFHLNPSMHVILVSAIAQSNYLSDHLNDKVANITDISFEDHHYFTELEVQNFIIKYKSLDFSNKIILTTEKDATRLILFKDLFLENNVPVYVIPIQVNFFEEQEFRDYISNFLLNFKI